MPLRRPSSALPIVLVWLGAVAGLVTGARVLSAAEAGMTWRDLVGVRQVFDEGISDDGSWIAFEARPDRGDGEVIARATRGSGEIHVPRGQEPQLSSDGSWLAAKVIASFEARETLEKDEIPDPAAALVRTRDGERTDFERVRSFAFSADGAWFAVHRLAPESTPEDSTIVEEVSSRPEGGAAAPAEEPAVEPAAEGTTPAGEPSAEREAGTRLELVRLADGARFSFEEVADWAFDPTGRWLAIVRATEDGAGNGLRVHALDPEAGDTLPVASDVAAAATAIPVLAWAEELPRLAYLRGDEAEPGKIENLTLRLFSEGTDREVVGPDDLPPGWILPEKNDLQFSLDGRRLFVGLRPAAAGADAAAEAAPDSTPAPFDVFDVDAILAERGVDVWHWRDPRIKTHEKATWKERQEHLFRAVVHLDEDRLVRLASEDLPDVPTADNPRYALGSDDTPYLREQTWDGFYRDLRLVDLRDGSRIEVVDRLQDEASLSPGGRFVVYFVSGDWWLFEAATGERRNLTTGLEVSFADEDFDYPREPSSYGVGGWASDDSAVLLHDKYDVWRFDTATAKAVCLTEGRGRAEAIQYRVTDLDEHPDGFEPGEPLLLTGFSERTKSSSFWRGAWEKTGVRLLRKADKFFRLRGRARDDGRILYSEERYDEFPDLWVADPEFRKSSRRTDVNPRLRDFDLGRAELVQWKSDDGVDLQGVLVYPAGYQRGRRYPVLVYYYRFFSQRLHRFNEPVINHRPSFYVYAGDGYAVFLPDIRFEVGRPGLAAVKCLVPGVQKLVEMGVADPDAVALHGHSWSGYQTAFAITQTDLFACAVAGAPVSNMTSAYGGIRYGSGLSRQFQYERTQSRLGASLFERRDLYIENSPVFYAERIHTPLLLMFGDEDEAVPWTQGIELYMAMRRLDRPAVFLQYRGEGHHPKKYANKLDYSMRMKAFIDHFCKGAPAPEWWEQGEAYSAPSEEQGSQTGESP